MNIAIDNIITNFASSTYQLIYNQVNPSPTSTTLTNIIVQILRTLNKYLKKSYYGKGFRIYGFQLTAKVNNSKTKSLTLTFNSSYTSAKDVKLLRVDSDRPRIFDL